MDLQTEAGVSQWGDGLGLVLHAHNLFLYPGLGLFSIRLDYHSTRGYKEDA